MHMIVLPPTDELQLENLKGIADGTFAIHEETVREIATWAYMKILGVEQEREAYEQVVGLLIQFRNAQEGKIQKPPLAYIQGRLDEAVNRAWDVHKRHPGIICNEEDPCTSSHPKPTTSVARSYAAWNGTGNERR